MNEINNVSEVGKLFNLTKYQDGTVAVSGRELHKGLGLGTQYTKWAKRMIDYGFEEKVDYVLVSQTKRTRNPRNSYTTQTNHMLSINTAYKITQLNNKSKNYEKVINELSMIMNKEIIIHKQQRKEFEFGKMLNTLTDIEWIEQYRVDNGKYRIDFYSDSLIVEYDEKYHQYQKEDDEERMEYILNWLTEKNLYDDGERYSPAVIRVKEGKELEGLKRIIKYIYYHDMESFKNEDIKPDIAPNFPDRTNNN